jgi:hypothetical protein
MNAKANMADNALLIGVVVVVAFVALGVIGAVISTVLFAIKLVILVAALAIGWRVVTAISGGAKRRELKP